MSLPYSKNHDLTTFTPSFYYLRISPLIIEASLPKKEGGTGFRGTECRSTFKSKKIIYLRPRALVKPNPTKKLFLIRFVSQSSKYLKKWVSCIISWMTTNFRVPWTTYKILSWSTPYRFVGRPLVIQSNFNSYVCLVWSRDFNLIKHWEYGPFFSFFYGVSSDVTGK